MICLKCNASLPKDGLFVTCSACAKCLHFTCSGLSESSYNRMSKSKKDVWRCFKCRETSKQSSSSESATPELDFDKEMEVKSMFITINTKLDGYKSSVDEMHKDIKGLSSFYDDLKLAISELQQQNKEMKNSLNALLEDNKAKDKKIAYLENRINIIEQHSRSVNFEIHGMEAREEERREGGLRSVVNKLLQAMDVKEVADTDMHVIHRLPVRRPGALPAVIVSCSSRVVRDKILLKRKSTVTNDILYSNGNQNKIFVCENLTPYNKSLLWKAKQKAKEMNFKFVWVKFGKIFTKKDETSGTLRIENDDDLRKIV
jgi:hypothetical protein